MLWKRQLVLFPDTFIQKAEASTALELGVRSQARSGRKVPGAFEQTHEWGFLGVLRSAGLGLHHLWGPPGLEPGAPHL